MPPRLLGSLGGASVSFPPELTGAASITVIVPRACQGGGPRVLAAHCPEFWRKVLDGNPFDRDAGVLRSPVVDVELGREVRSTPRKTSYKPTKQANPRRCATSGSRWSSGCRSAATGRTRPAAGGTRTPAAGAGTAAGSSGAPRPRCSAAARTSRASPPWSRASSSPSPARTSTSSRTPGTATTASRSPRPVRFLL